MSSQVDEFFGVKALDSTPFLFGKERVFPRLCREVIRIEVSEQTGDSYLASLQKLICSKSCEARWRTALEAVPGYLRARQLLHVVQDEKCDPLSLHQKLQQASTECKKSKGDEQANGFSFRVTCERSGKHSFNSVDIASELGASIHDSFNWRVNLKNFDIEILLHIHNEIVQVAVVYAKASISDLITLAVLADDLHALTIFGNKLFEPLNAWRHNTLHLAMLTENVKIIKYLSAATTLLSTSCLLACDKTGKTFMHYAAMWGVDQLFLVLPECKANVPAVIHAVDQSGKNALYYAVEGGHLTIVKYLLRYRASPLQMQSDVTIPPVLHSAVLKGDSVILGLLLDSLSGIILEDTLFTGNKSVFSEGLRSGNYFCTSLLVQACSASPETIYAKCLPSLEAQSLSKERAKSVIMYGISSRERAQRGQLHRQEESRLQFALQSWTPLPKEVANIVFDYANG